MNKKFRVITINGISGMLTVIFVIFGLISGFIVSPGWLCMHIWNYVFKNSSTVSCMNIYEGIILWAIIALSLYALNNKRTLIGFDTFKGLSSDQIQDIMASSGFSNSRMMGMEIMERKRNEELENEKDKENVTDEEKTK